MIDSIGLPCFHLFVNNAALALDRVHCFWLLDLEDIPIPNNTSIIKLEKISETATITSWHSPKSYRRTRETGCWGMPARGT